MKKYFLFSAGLVALSLFFVSTLTSQKSIEETNTVKSQINWLSLDEASELAQQNAKPILIDVYTDWCKWCKVMDQNTFQDKEVIQYVNQNYYAVKLNAEQKQTVKMNGVDYNYVSAGRKGINTVTIELLGDRPSYPSLVLLNKDLAGKQILKGFQKKEALLPVLSNYLDSNSLSSN